MSTISSASTARHMEAVPEHAQSMIAAKTQPQAPTPQEAHFASYAEIPTLPEAKILPTLFQLHQRLKKAGNGENTGNIPTANLSDSTEACHALSQQLSRPLEQAGMLAEDPHLTPMLDELSAEMSTQLPHFANAQQREQAEQLLRAVNALSTRLKGLQPDKDGDVFYDAAESQGTLSKILHRTDAHAALTQADNALFKQQLRGEYGQKVNEMIQHAQGLDALLKEAGLPAAAEKDLRTANKHVLSELNALRNGSPLTERLLRGAATLAAYPLPLAIALVNDEKEYSSTLIPHFVKNALLLTGLMVDDSTNHQSLVQHANNRLFVNGVVGLIYAGPTFINAMKPLHGNPVFSGVAGAVSGAATFAWFNQKQVTESLHKIQNKMTSLVFGDKSDTLTLREDAKQQVREFINDMQNNRQLLSGMEQAFVNEGGHKLSDNLNAQLSRTLGQMDTVIKTGNDLLNDTPHAQQPDTPAVTASANNADRLSKLGLTAFTAGICGSVVALMSDNPVGMVDYIVDGLWCSHEMYKQASDPNVNLQGAVQTFKELVGLNLTMIAYLSANKGYDFLHKGSGNYAAGTAAMTLANLTIPGIVGNAVGNSAGAALKKGGELAASTRQNLSGAMNYLYDRVNHLWQAPTNSGVQQHEMQPTELAWHAADDLEAQPVKDK